MQNLPDSYNNISDLDYFHLYADAMFNSHQIAIMEGNAQQALSILTHLEQLMIRHIRDEEDLLLPPYREKIPTVPAGGAIEFYQREHRQIGSFLRRFIDHQPFNQNEISIVHYFDMCTMYKDLTEHHHARERTFLYRLLDRKLVAQEKTKILDTFTKHQINAD